MCVCVIMTAVFLKTPVAARTTTEAVLRTFEPGVYVCLSVWTDLLKTVATAFDAAVTKLNMCVKFGEKK